MGLIPRDARAGSGYRMRLTSGSFPISALGFLGLSLAIILGWWAWLGATVPLPPSPLTAGEKLQCVSYAPFRGRQTPWMGVDVTAAQIDEDLSRLKNVTDCIRTYSIDHGLDQIPAIAGRHGLKVIQGLWLSSRPDLSRIQINGAIDLARRHPDIIQAIVVGNEVLLRGEMSAAQLLATIREVKAAVPAMPVTYADVWEFWLRNRDLAAAVDFVTVHILPYWEDEPIAVDKAVPHLNDIRKRVIAAFPGKDILIGETGWPSAGRMREGALPSPVNQGRYISEVLALARTENFRVNVIEAFDQPWKRGQEGTVGGHWGLYDDPSREPKFNWGAGVSDHPHWPWQAAGGIVLALLVFGAAASAREPRRNDLPVWAGVGVIATVAGCLAGWAVAKAPLESLGLGGWLRSGAWVFVALLAPLAAGAAMTRGERPANFAQVLAGAGRIGVSPLSLALGGLLIALTALAVHAAMGLTFDPRYRDFPFAALTAAGVPFMVLSLFREKQVGIRPRAETVAAVTLALAALYIVFNESFANWTSVWFCAGLALVTGILLRVRAAPG